VSSSRYVEIDADDWRFQPRVAAVCVWREQVLLQGALDGDFWVLPGGRILPMELTADALIRTLRWETGEDVAIRRLLWVMEYVAPMRGQLVHELGFYYAIDLSASSRFRDLTSDHAAAERGQELVLRWFAIDSLPSVPLFPEFLRTSVQHMPDSPQHVVRVDDAGRAPAV
jgi:ADP-ribose pyrophosphatase YjhB (NUDIX family)